MVRTTFLKPALRLFVIAVLTVVASHPAPITTSASSGGQVNPSHVSSFGTMPGEFGGTISYTGYADATFDGQDGVVDAYANSYCVGCRTPTMTIAVASQSSITVSDELTFFTGLGGGFLEIEVHRIMGSTENGSSCLDVNGIQWRANIAVNDSGTSTTPPAPFTDGIPIPLQISGLAGANAVCCGYGEIDAGNGSAQFSLRLIILDADQHDISHLIEYSDNSGISYAFEEFGMPNKIAPVPEPRTWMLLVLSGAVLGLWRRKPALAKRKTGK